MTCSWSAAGRARVWTVPEGQRMTALSTRALCPSPKWSRRSFWLANPEPRPGAGVFEYVSVRAGDLGHGVPVAPTPVPGDVAVDDEQFVASVVVQVAQLRTPGPPRVDDDPLGALLEASQLWQEVQAQVVPLKQVAALRD